MANKRKLCALLASTALVIGGDASAADMALKAPSAAPVPFTWTSCYVGAHAGLGVGHTKFSDPTGLNIANAGQTIGIDEHGGPVLGGQVGCDYEFATNWVIGVGGDFAWANIAGQGNDPFFFGKTPAGVTLHSRTDFLATATGRLGYAFDHLSVFDHVMVYAKAGAAWSHDRYNAQNLFAFNNFFCPGNVFFGDGPCYASGSTTSVGWTAGAGAEWAFTNNWSALAEFDYYGFGNKTVTFTDPVISQAAPINVRQSFEVAKVGINYRFK